MNTTPEKATIKLVDSDSVIDEFVSKYCRHLEGAEAVERLKLEIKGIKSIM